MNYVLRGFLLPIICLFAIHSPAAGASRCKCFPTERLPADLRVKSEALLLKALDSEALYAIVGGLKQMSSGFAIKSSAALILAEYQKRRSRDVGPGKRGVVKTLRDWLNDGKD